MLQLLSRYTAFAMIAIVVNLVTQRIVLWMLADNEPMALPAAVVAGTGAGLVAKYILDKKWIFFDNTDGLANHGRKFGLYTLMGIFTTLIFWASETFFWLAWKTDLAREIGAVIGLTVGYVVKYNLDRRFVFVARQTGA